ncbi:MAG: hypothetical protein Q4Q31_08880 [Bacillota bacterium]|nr:hypothetical protein [Bacillota bacterium]
MYDYEICGMALFLSEIYPLKVDYLGSLVKSYVGCEFYGIPEQQCSCIKRYQDVAYVLNRKIVKFSDLQELIEDSQMDIEDEGSFERVFQTTYYISVFEELVKLNPVLLWKMALIFADFMNQNYDELIKRASISYDMEQKPYEHLYIINHDGYLPLIETIKRGIFQTLNLRYKECSLKEIIQILDNFEDNKYVQLLLCYLASNYSYELYVLGCATAATFEVLGNDLNEDLNKEVEVLLNE